MATSTKNIGNQYIVKDLAELATLVSTGVPDGSQILFNGVSATLFTGASAPTAQTKAFSVGDVYVANNKIYHCTGISVAGTTYTYTWTEVVTPTDIADVLRYSAQTLTSAQKSQSRANIDAYTLTEYTGSETSYDEQTLYFTTD